MSTTPRIALATVGGSKRSSLLRAEVRRFRARSFINSLILLVLVGLLFTVAILFTQHEQASPQALAQAQEQIDARLADAVADRQACVDSLRPGQNPNRRCGPVPTASNISSNYLFLETRNEFRLSSQLPEIAMVLGAGLAALAFLIGATWIGAEWSTKSLTYWLSWEPRRVRVMVSKITVLALAVGTVAAALQLAWTLSAWWLGSTKGNTDVPPGFWGETWALQGRLVIVAVLAALVGFGFANLIRNTGAALGLAFVYFALGETAVRTLKPDWQQWLASDNAIGFVLKGGYTIQWSEQEGFEYVYRSVLISNARGGIALTLGVVAVLAVGIALFKRRDAG